MPDVRKPYYCLPTTAIFFMTIRTGQAQSISYVATHLEKKIVVEADTPKEAIAALRAQPDVLQLDKFSPQQATEIAQIAPSLAPHCTLALTGGINLTTLKITSTAAFASLLPPRLITRHRLTLKSVCNPQPLFNSLLNGIYSMRLKNIISAQHYHLPLPSRP